ncbi:MAG TPA: hypothetical protein VNK41_10435, partial [Vicinamibacterales bacterium]|nr:hypothetical protein [Vicinamibacterales bacterium]
LAVLLGRPLGPDEYPQRVRELLNEACDPLRWSLVPPLRQWLDRALRLESHTFHTAQDALDELDRLLPRVSGMWASRLLPQNLAAEVGIPEPEPVPEPSPEPQPHLRLPEAHRISTADDSRTLDDTAPQIDWRPWDASEEPARETAEAARFDPAPGASPSLAQGSAASWTARGIFAVDEEESGADAVSTAAAPSGILELQRQTIQRLWLLCGGLAIVAVLEALCLFALLAFRG